MKTSKSAWTRAEASAAAFFGARRRVLSGSANRSDIDGDDSTHERLFIESKLREKHAVWTLWRATKALAAKCRKRPVLALREKHKQGTLFVVHSDDFCEIVLEYLAAQSATELEWIESEVRIRRGVDDAGADAQAR